MALADLPVRTAQQAPPPGVVLLIVAGGSTRLVDLDSAVWVCLKANVPRIGIVVALPPGASWARETRQARLLASTN